MGHAYRFGINTKCLQFVSPKVISLHRGQGLHMILVPPICELSIGLITWPTSMLLEMFQHIMWSQTLNISNISVLLFVFFFPYHFFMALLFLVVQRIVQLICYYNLKNLVWAKKSYRVPSTAWKIFGTCFSLISSLKYLFQ